MTGQEIAAVVTAMAALVAAVSVALWRRRQTQVAGWQHLVAEMQDRIDSLHQRQDATERTVVELRTEVDRYRSDIRVRDRLILAHLAWDTEVLVRLGNAAHADIGTPPPLWPQEV